MSQIGSSYFSGQELVSFPDLETVLLADFALLAFGTEGRKSGRV